MGMVFQAYSLFPNMTAEQNVEYGLKIRKKPKDEPASAGRASCSSSSGSADAGKRYPHQLSGGMQQRVALARALAIEPSVLLLDEPLSALDAKVRVQLREEIRRIQLELGITTLYVTHDQEEALSISDRVAVMYGGKIEQIGAPAEMYGSPATPFVAEFIGTMNRLDRDRDRRRRDRLRRPACSGSTRRAACRAGSGCSASCGPRRSTSWPQDGAAPESALAGEVISQHLPRLDIARAGRRRGGERTLTADISTARAAPLTVGTKVVASFPPRQPSPAQPGRRASASRARPGQSVKTPSTPSSRSSQHARRLVDRVDGRLAGRATAPSRSRARVTRPSSKPAAQAKPAAARIEVAVADVLHGSQAGPQPPRLEDRARARTRRRRRRPGAAATVRATMSWRR